MLFLTFDLNNHLVRRGIKGVRKGNLRVAQMFFCEVVLSMMHLWALYYSLGPLPWAHQHRGNYEATNGFDHNILLTQRGQLHFRQMSFRITNTRHLLLGSTPGDGDDGVGGNNRDCEIVCEGQSCRAAISLKIHPLGNDEYQWVACYVTPISIYHRSMLSPILIYQYTRSKIMQMQLCEV